MSRGIILGLDYSSRKIGVATGQKLTHTASALTTIINQHKGQPQWQALDEIIKQWQPQQLVVGLPLTREGAEQDTTRAARAFGVQLQNRYDIPVAFMDERYSSREASYLLGYDGHTSPRRESRPGKKVKKRQSRGLDIDSMAAQLILQSWLNVQG